jgi:putative spermidine/putrescine transport system substrate-binding protein
MAVAAAAVFALGACSSGGGGGDWKSAPDATKAKAEGAEFVTYGLPDDWANYGESLKQFCAKYEIAGCKHTDTDMTSGEEIQKYTAEKNNPVVVFSDIGIAYGPVAETAGVVPLDYLPPSAAKLPAQYKAAKGGWVGTFFGVPTILVNLDALKAKGLVAPKAWTDLADPKYKGLIGMPKVGTSGQADSIFTAWNITQGGTETDFGPGVALAKKIVPNLAADAGNADTAEKGEIPIILKYDFNNLAILATLKAKGIDAVAYVPTDGSVYTGSGLMVNVYNTKQMDVAKLFMEWVLSDAGQTVMANFGARPLRYVLGDLQLSAEAKANWLPDEQYANVKRVDQTKITPSVLADTWNKQVLGQ